MRHVYTFAFAVCFSVSGFTVHAQSGATTESIEAMIQQLTAVGASPGVTVSDVVQGVAGQLMATSAPAEQQASAIEGQLVVETEVSEVNLAAIEIIDTRTGRYLPRLKVDFAEFPLRSLTEAVPNNGRNGRAGQTGTQAEMIVRRIQNRLGLPELHLAIEDRTVIISGTVATERQRSQIESMLGFEPGISKIQNNLSVAP